MFNLPMNMMPPSVDLNALLASALAHYDASDDAYLSLSGSSIIQFLDRTGKGNHTTSQGTSTARMTRTTNQQNGLATAVADGGDYHHIPSGVYGLSAGNNTVFCVNNCTNEASVRYYVCATSAASVISLFLRSELTSGQVSYTTSGASGNRVTATGITKANYNIHTCKTTGTTQSISINNAAAVTNSSGGAVKLAATAMTLGAFPSLSGFLIGGIAELIMFDSALSAAEISAVNSYLSTKWGIAIS